MSLQCYNNNSFNNSTALLPAIDFSQKQIFPFAEVKQIGNLPQLPNLHALDAKINIFVNNTCSLNGDINPKEFYDHHLYLRIDRMISNPEYNQTVQNLLGKHARYANYLIEKDFPFKNLENHEVEVKTDYNYLNTIVELGRYLTWGQFCSRSNLKDCYKFFAVNPDTLRVIASTYFNKKTIVDKFIPSTIGSNVLDDIFKISTPAKAYIFNLQNLYLPKFVEECVERYKKYLVYTN